MTMLADDTKRRPRNPLAFLRGSLFNKSAQPDAIDDERDVAAAGVFGAPLEIAAYQYGSLTDAGLCVPDPVMRCFTEIMERGLRTEGLFRLSGAASEVNALECAFNRAPLYGKQLDLANYDIHAITGVVKKYLRHLPEPVIPHAYHAQFLQAADDYSTDPSGMIQALSTLIAQLPRTHSHLLYYILWLAAQIQRHADVNMMNPEALAVVLAPVSTGLEQTLKCNIIPSKKQHRRLRQQQEELLLRRRGDMDNLIQKNAQWTLLWTQMIEHHEILLEHILQHAGQQPNEDECMINKDEDPEQILSTLMRDLPYLSNCYPSTISLASSSHRSAIPDRPQTTSNNNNNRSNTQNNNNNNEGRATWFNTTTAVHQACAPASWTTSGPRRVLRRLASVSSIRPRSFIGLSSMAA